MSPRARARRTIRTWAAEVDRRVDDAPFEVPITILFALVGWVGVLTGQGITPPSLEAALPLWLVQTWTVSFALGGSLAAHGKTAGSERTEAAGLVMLGWGLTLYGVVLIGSAGLAGVTSAVGILAIATGAALRLRKIRRDYRARVLAAAIVRRYVAREQRGDAE